MISRSGVNNGHVTNGSKHREKKWQNQFGKRLTALKDARAQLNVLKLAA